MNNKTSKDLEDFCSKYYNSIHMYCLHAVNGDHYVADDITGETFLLFMQKWENFNFNSHEHKMALSWLYKTAKLKILEHSRQKHPVSVEDELSYEDTTYLTSEDESIRFEKYIELVKEKLTPEECNLFEHIVINNKNYQEVSVLLGISKRATALRWYRLKHKIKQWIPEILE